jgi:hypothetical protein
MNKRVGLNSIVILILLLTTMASANNDTPKQALKTNYQIIYNKAPKSVENIIDMLKEGMFYGRLRSNTFYYTWEKETSTQYNQTTSGLGGSLIYQSANYNNFDFRAGLYYSRGFFNVANNDISKIKAGNTEVLSHFDYSNDGSKDMFVLGQAYINYKGIPKTKISIGRQLVETFYTASNDTKMIPNTFDGVVLQTKALPKTNIKLAYLAEQKLRGHTSSHSVLMYGDSNSSSSLNPSWSENDDSAMHKGLTYTRLKAAGISTDAPLIVGDIHNKSINNLIFDASFYTVPELLSEVMGEVNYKFKVGKFSLVSGARYIRQLDDGAGKVGGASYSGTLAGLSGASGGYKNADSLDSQMIAVRLLGGYGIYKLNLAYSQVFDEADLITPWRAFPTSGYTRSMARYNWIANTKSYRAKLSINPNKTGIYKDIYMEFSILHTDSDESKGQYDENYYYAGFVQNLPFMQDLQWRLRLGYTDTKKTDADNLDSRFELNYLF